MSRDIRSFFSLKCSSSNQKKLSTISEPVKKSNYKKRAAIIIDSDSDEEDAYFVKRNKPSLKTEKLLEKKTTESSKTTSKYFKQEEVNIDDLFAAKPVKRDNSGNIIKRTFKKDGYEVHSDKDFEKELLTLDEKPVNLDKEETHCKVENPLKGLLEVKSICKKDLINVTSDEELESKPSPKKKRKYDSKEKLTNNKSSLNFEINKDLHSPLKSLSSRSSPRRQTSQSPLKGKSSQSSKSPSKKTLFVSSPLKISSIKTKTPTKKEVDQNQNTEKINALKEVTKSLQKKTEKEKENLSVPSIKPLKDKNACPNILPDASCNLWVEKYKPNSIRQIIGQQGDSSCVNKLIFWLKNWYKNQSGSKKIAKPSPWAKNDDGSFFKAALLSGPPGVGKTTTAHLVSKELGFDVVEFNASDTRSKKLLHQEVSELLSTNSLSPFFTGSGDQVTKQHVLVMDEVDGMAGNEDRGGVQELIQLIKQSRIPIICMCNDRNHPKIRSLANYCFDLRFSKPRVEQIKGAMLTMCFKEQLKIVPNVLTDIICSANQDIRLIINHLSMLKIENSELAHSTKHIKMGPWDITRKIFSEEEHKTMSIYDKSDLFFHDYSVTPLFVQENYLNAVPHKQEAKNKIQKMELFAKAANSLSIGDITEKLIRSHNVWSLLPTQAIFSSVVPGDVLEGHLGRQITFPLWFGKNSRQGKMSRLLQELTAHSRLKISGNKESMNLDYRGLLERSILTPLVKEGVNGVPQSLAVLAEYCLVREDIESLSELSSWPDTTSLFSKVDSKVKAAFTRMYNKTSVPTPYAAVQMKKGRGGEVDHTDPLLEDEDEPDDEQEDKLEVDSMIVVKKKPVGKKIEKDAAPTTSKGNKNSKRGRKK